MLLKSLLSMFDPLLQPILLFYLDTVEDRLQNRELTSEKGQHRR